MGESDAFFVCAYLSTLLFIGGFEWYARQRSDAFYCCGYISIILVIGGVEWYARQALSTPSFPLK
ncbi:hypothetical protein T484DRAFT_1895758 [Baffinella frigidus]|nr:hypothetical protein T484DRAFT_1895758 [Cryptophyta sp. CCMP2293]